MATGEARTRITYTVSRRKFSTFLPRQRRGQTNGIKRRGMWARGEGKALMTTYKNKGGGGYLSC